MFSIVPQFEQLEQAAKFLDEASPPYARLALIFLDNVAEVAMYQRVRHEFAKDQAYGGSRPPKYAPKKRDDVLQHFDAKVNFVCTEIDVIDADDGKFLKFAHSLRNEAYHKDEYHRDVMIPVARTYLGIVCRVYPQIRIPAVVSSDSKSEQTFLDQHGLPNADDLLSGGLERICDQLAAKHTCELNELASALSRNLVRRIDEILGTEEETGFLETLMDGNSDGSTDIDMVLKRILFFDSYQPEAGPAQTHEEFRRAIKRRESEFAKFRSPACVKTLRRWRQTAQSLTPQNGPGELAERYKSVEQDFSRIEEQVHQAVQEFDEWVNNEVDAMRGN